MKSIPVLTTINGDPHEFLCAPDETLLDVLRNRLGLTGAKEGCGTGDCGACSVTLDGRLVCSCLVLGAEADEADGRVEQALKTIRDEAATPMLHLPSMTVFRPGARCQ